MPISSLLSRSLQSKAYALPARVTPSYQLINGRLVPYTDNLQTPITKGYNINDIVYSIVNLIMEKCRVAPWGIYEIADETAYKSLHGMQRKSNWTAKDFSQAHSLQKKALRLVNNPGKWGDLIKNPNDTETFNDYVANGIGYECLVGNNYTWANVLQAGANKGVPSELWLLPAQWINIFATDTFPTRVTNYQVSIWPGVNYQPGEVLHEKTWNPNWNTNGEQLYGLPPLKASLRRMQNNNSSVDSQTADFENNGVKGVLHMKAQPGQISGEELLPEVNSLKQTVVSEWSGVQNRGRMGISGYDMGWLPIGLTAEEMQIIESQKWSLRMLCNPFGVPSQLLNDDQKAYNNFAEAEKSLTMRACLPRLTRKRDNLTMKAQKDWGLDKRYVIDFDMTVFSELQEDMKDMVSWLTPLLDRGLPLNRVLELLALEKIDHPYYDQPRITPQMGESLEDYQLNDIDNALNNDNGQENI